MKNNKICKIFIMIFSFVIFFNVKASTSLTYNNSAQVLQNYYNSINKSDFFIHSNAGLITINEYNKTLSSDAPGSTFLYNGKTFLFKDASILNQNAEIKTIGPDENTNARLSVLLNRGIKVKGSGTKADPYAFVDTSDIKIISMKKDGVDVTEVPNVGKYDFVSNCIGGSASYSNTTHELSIKITKVPVICSLEFNEIKSAKIVAHIYGANTETNEKDMLLGENGYIEYTLKSGYNNEAPYMYCEKGTTLTYSSTKITINNVSKEDTCYVFFPKTISYTSDTTTEKILIGGTYKIEAWGAQGKNYSSSYQGGKGGYVAGQIVLAKDTILTIKIGKQDGTNGGGVATHANTNCGGGSTQILKGSTILLTAAGGGGASRSNSGGAGGNGTGVAGYATSVGSGQNGSNGGGGSSSPYGSYGCGCSSWCATSLVEKCDVTVSWRNCMRKCGDSSDPTTCGDVCDEVHTKVCSLYCPNTVYDCSPCQTNGSPGQGGKSTIGTGVTQLSKIDGNNIGDGKVKITLLSR